MGPAALHLVTNQRQFGRAIAVRLGLRYLVVLTDQALHLLFLARIWRLPAGKPLPNY